VLGDFEVLDRPARGQDVGALAAALKAENRAGANFALSRKIVGDICHLFRSLEAYTAPTLSADDRRRVRRSALSAEKVLRATFRTVYSARVTPPAFLGLLHTVLLSVLLYENE